MATSISFDSDSGDESDFSGFGESDVDVPYVHEQSSDDSSDEDEQAGPGASPVRDDGWTRNYSDLRVGVIDRLLYSIIN